MFGTHLELMRQDSLQLVDGRVLHLNLNSWKNQKLRLFQPPKTPKNQTCIWDLGNFFVTTFPSRRLGKPPNGGLKRKGIRTPKRPVGILGKDLR